MPANLYTQTEPRRCTFLMKAALALAAAALTACAPAMKSDVSEGTAPKGVGTIVRLDPAFDAIVSKDAVIEKVAGGFQFTEGPLWRSDGHLWFSDVTGNVVRSITPDGQVKVLIENAGGETSAPPGSFIPGLQRPSPLSATARTGVDSIEPITMRGRVIRAFRRYRSPGCRAGCRSAA